MTESPRTGTIVAVVTEDGADAVRRRAIELARASGASLILWDADAGRSLLEDPLPNEWSAHGEREQFGDRLSVNDLEAAGRASLARQVREAQQAGVEAWGWLPPKDDPDTLRDYLAAQGADAVVIGANSKVADSLEGSDVRVEVARPG
jgi:nucleotide-binding universal stress UspA family protein